MAFKPLSIVSYIRSFVEKSSSDLAPYVVAGKLNNEYIRGNQYKKVNSRNLRIEDKPNPNPAIYTERKTFNRMFPIYLTRYGILTQNMPIPGFKSSDSSYKKANDVAKGNAFIRAFLNDASFKNKTYNKSIRSADIYAISWYKTGIDWSDGDDIAEIEIEVKDPNGETKKGKRIIKEGRCFIDCIPMHEVLVDNYNAETMDDINELVHRRPFSLDYILRRWGFQAKAESISEPKLQSYPRYSNSNYASGGEIEYAYVLEYYKRADALYPNGRHIILCSDQIIHDGELPYKNGKGSTRHIPFDFLNMQSVSNYLIGTTVYSQIIPIQDVFNSVKNRYLEYVNHISIGQLYYWEGSLMNSKEFTTKPGKLIGLKRNARKPEPVMKDKLSAEFINYIKMLDEDMLLTAGLSPISAYGTAKSAMRTDGVVDKLTESDQNKLNNAVDNISTAIINSFKKILYLEKERQEYLMDSLHLAQKDDYVLKYRLGDLDPEQLTIVNREFLMQSDQVLDKKLQQANQLGLYNPMAGLSYVSKLELLDSMQANYLRDSLDPVERLTHELVEEEQYQILDGTDEPPVEEFHIHKQHVFEHNLFRISAEVKNLKRNDPKKYALVMDKLNGHIAKHQKYLKPDEIQEAYANAKAQMQSGTAPKGKPFGQAQM